MKGVRPELRIDQLLVSSQIELEDTDQNNSISFNLFVLQKKMSSKKNIVFLLSIGLSKNSRKNVSASQNFYYKMEFFAIIDAQVN